MAAFEYKAISSNGKTHRGIVDADSTREANGILKTKGLTPLFIEVAGEANNKESKRKGTKLSIADLCIVTRQFATLIGSGMTIDDSIQAIAQQAPSQKVANMMGDIRTRVTEGFPLSEALKSYPRTFSPIYIASFKAGEQSGKLDVISERLADFLERRQTVAQNISTALVYPVFLLLASISIVVALVAYVVPKVVSVFEQSGNELPTVTQWLIATSSLLADYGWLIVLLLVLVAVGFNFLRKIARINYLFHDFYLKLPLVGNLIRASESAAMARTLSIMTSSGVPLLSGLQASSDVIKNLVLKRELQTASEDVAQGVPISKALAKGGNFPPLLIQMVASGEKNGRLPEMLERVAYSTENETQSRLNTFVSLFEPIMILVMGAIVLIIVLAILIPIFDLNRILA